MRKGKEQQSYRVDGSPGFLLKYYRIGGPRRYIFFIANSNHTSEDSHSASANHLFQVPIPD